MSNEEKMKKREEVIQKIDQLSYMQAGYTLATLELNALYKETSGKGFLRKVAESMMV